MFQTRLMIGLLVTVLFLPVAAQNYPSELPTIRSRMPEYGTARRHVDVTNRLKELARQDRAFRMGNSTFGIDPDPGQEDAPYLCSRAEWARAYV